MVFEPHEFNFHLPNTDFIILGSKISAHRDCCHEIKTFLQVAPWKKIYNKPRWCIQKSRDTTLLTKVHSGSDGKASVYNVGARVQALGWQDPLVKEMAIHSSIIAWKIPWTEEPGRL